MTRKAIALIVGVSLSAAAFLGAGCNPPFPAILNNTAGGLFVPGRTFMENLIQSRTFTDGTAVTTVTYAVNDRMRRPLGIDFNSDGKVDPVVGYGRNQGVIQILLSNGPRGRAEFVSLTLDSKRDMQKLSDVAVGDIDGDGFLDIVAAADGAVWYFRHPANGQTTNLPLWGNQAPDDDLRERIESSAANVSNDDLQAIISQAIGPGVNIDDYVVTVEQRYTSVEIGDFDGDGTNDIAASRSFVLNLEPRPSAPVEAIEILDGDVFVFLNPGGAIDGRGWTAVSVGRHERQLRLDRDGAAGLLIFDMDGDGDLDIVSAAQKDNNAQVAWFENPGAPLDPGTPWVQWRIGSVRDAWAIDVGDLTGDGRPDVVASGPEQQQILLFEQPASGPKRTFDWDTHVIVTFESFQPLDVKLLDLDNDGVRELVCGGTGGAVRYFEPGANARRPWTPFVVITDETGGDVGLIGYGDLDADGDLDLVVVVDAKEENGERIAWIRNDL